MATFDLKPPSHTQNALLACASGKKLPRENELDESASLSLSVGLLLDIVQGIITYEWTAATDGAGMDGKGYTAPLL